MGFCLTENNISELQMCYVQKLSWETHRKHTQDTGNTTQEIYTHVCTHLCLQCMHRRSMAPYVV